MLTLLNHLNQKRKRKEWNSTFPSLSSNISEPYSYLSPIPNKTLDEIHQEHQNDVACHTIWNGTFFPMSSVTINCTTNGLVLLPKFFTCIAQITNQKSSLSRLFCKVFWLFILIGSLYQLLGFHKLGSFIQYRFAVKVGFHPPPKNMSKITKSGLVLNLWRSNT